MSMPVAPGRAWVNATPTVRLKAGVMALGVDPGRIYDVGADGRLLITKQLNRPDSQGFASIVVVQHWTEELKRLAPLKF